MKRIFAIVFAVLICPSFMRAQLVLDSLGRVGVGTVVPKSKFQVGDDGLPCATASVHSEDEIGLSVFLRNNDSKTKYPTGIKVYSFSKAPAMLGVDVKSYGNRDSLSYAIGLRGSGGNAHNCAGICGYRSGSNITNFAGVYGTSSPMGSLIFRYPGVYAGYFLGDLLVTHKIYGRLFSLTQVPSSKMAENAHSFYDVESVSEKLSSVQTIQFLSDSRDELMSGVDEHGFVQDDEMEKQEGVLSTQTSSSREFKSSRTGEGYRVCHGLNPEQLESVYPELVSRDEQGNFFVNYVEIVPLLVQSIRELSARVAELESGNGMGVIRKAKALSAASGGGNEDAVPVAQNSLNSFSEGYTVTLDVPQNAKNATVFIYDANRICVKKIIVKERGRIELPVRTTDIMKEKTDTFIYSLVVDGIVVETRRMIVTPK